MNEWERRQWRDEICSPYYDWLLFHDGAQPKDVTAERLNALARESGYERPNLSDFQQWLDERSRTMQHATGMAIVVQAIANE